MTEDFAHNSWAQWVVIFTFLAFLCYVLAIWTTNSIQHHFIQSGLACSAFAFLLAIPATIHHVRNRS